MWLMSKLLPRFPNVTDSGKMIDVEKMKKGKET
jgi:hypothetical protein